MSNPQFEYPEWEAPLQEIVFEYDREKLSEKIKRVETLIFERLRQPLEVCNGRDQREALNEALSTLQSIKRDRLGIADSR